MLIVQSHTNYLSVSFSETRTNGELDYDMKQKVSYIQGTATITVAHN